MSWWGKVIGGTLGFMIGGPLGALLGVALGHQLDDTGPVLDWTGAAGGDNERIQTVFFTTTFSVMGHLCKADGRVSEDEIRIARAVMAHMQLNSEQEKAAERLFSQGKDDGFPLTQVIHQFRQETRRRRDLVRVFMELQVQAAMADGIITDAERDVLYTLCRELSFSAIELAHIEALVRAQQAGGPRTGGQRHAPRRASLSEAYEVLGIARDASDAEVKKAYRRLMNQHHPDKLVSRGLPEEMIQVAQEKASDISKAYEQIKEARGFK